MNTMIFTDTLHLVKLMKDTTIKLAFTVFLLNSLTSHAQTKEFATKIETLFNQEQFEEIIQNTNEIKNYSTKQQDSTSAELLYFLGDAYLALDRLPEALKIMELELSLRQDLDAQDPILIADLYYNLSYYLSLSGDNKVAISNLKKAISIYEEYYESNNEIIVSSKIELAKILSNAGNEAEAIKMLKELNRFSSSSEFDFQINKELGNALMQLGNYSKSSEYLNKAYEIAKDQFGEKSIQYLEATVYLGDLNFTTSNYSKAEFLYSNAIDAANKIGGLNQEISILTNNLALLYWRMGLNEEAFKLISSISFEGNDAMEADRLQNKALILSKLERYDSANKYFEQAFNLLGDGSPKKPEFLKNQASIIFINSSSFTQAIKSLKEAKTLVQKRKPVNKTEYSKYEFQLGKAYYKINDIPKAEKHLTAAHNLRVKHLNKNHPLYAESSKELAELAWYKNSSKKAEEYYNETFNNYFAQIEAYFPALSEQQKANFYTNTLRPTFEEFNSFAIAFQNDKPHLLGDMYDYQLATKGIIMYATAKARKNILNSGNTELKDKYENWISTKELISQLYSMSEEEIQQQDLKLDSLISVSADLEKELSRASAEFAEAYSAKNYTWKDVQAKLKDNEAAIEMIRFREFTPDSSGQFQNKVNYAALLIDKDSKYPELILFENGAELENKYIKNYRNTIRYQVKDKYSYDFYWRPIAEKTKQYEKLYFSPDGIYNQISVNALLNTESGKYVLEEQNIELLTNTKDLIAYRENKTNSNLASAPALFGFPNYNKGLDEAEENNKNVATNIVENASLNRGLRGSLQRYIRGNALVTELPGTKEEINKIGSIYSNSDLDQPKTFLQNEADELQIKSVENPQVLHIATHGFFLEDNESTNNEEDKYSDNPLLKSGLIMAGANSFISSGLNQNARQDGILTAYEAMNLDLSDTELVVLSACETGLGELKNGEGVYGLRRAFQVAGADAIIMSLWSVDDQATQELMTNFYQNWIGGQDKLTAFKNAQQTIKDNYESPFYWGAFVLIGE